MGREKKQLSPPFLAFPKTLFSIKNKKKTFLLESTKQPTNKQKMPKNSNNYKQKEGRADPSTFDHQTLPNGKPNPKYVDLLDEDTPLPGQKYGLFSFLSPEKILKKREMYLFDEFVKQWDFARSMNKFADFLNFIAYKYNMSIETLQADFTEFVQDERPRLFAEQTVEDDFKTFLDRNEDELNAKFNKEHAFQTSVRGFMFRGAFDTVEEAKQYCAQLQEKNADHDIFVGKSFAWQIWHPDAYKTGDVQFLEEELNQLYHEKIKNEMKAKQEFDNRVKETKLKAIQENVEKAKKSGNTLTQTIDEGGNLVGVREQVNFEERDAAEANTASIHEELYRQALSNAEDTTTTIDPTVD